MSLHEQYRRWVCYLAEHGSPFNEQESKIQEKLKYIYGMPIRVPKLEYITKRSDGLLNRFKKMLAQMINLHHNLYCMQLDSKNDFEIKLIGFEIFGFVTFNQVKSGVALSLLVAESVSVDKAHVLTLVLSTFFTWIITSRELFIEDFTITFSTVFASETQAQRLLEDLEDPVFVNSKKKFLVEIRSLENITEQDIFFHNK
jgi:hypothetical protein